MLTAAEWSGLKMLRRNQFEFPDQLHPTVVIHLDALAQMLGVVPEVLSDVRPAEREASQHSPEQGGRAIDTAWHGIDPVRVWETAKRSMLFSGLGIYLNERGAVSFHFDTRTDRTPANPAQWGTLIKPGAHGRERETTSAANVLELVKKKPLLLVVPLSILLWLLLRRSRRT